MRFTVLLCFLTTALLPFCSTHLSKDVRYECGSHGKFEYCIDDIPGCVIGCHCHPGYYFDTDTKICEPNIRLTQDFRRHYLMDPSRVHEPPPILITTTEAIPTLLTPTNKIDDKGEESPKDTDELGDWLYNQFFKTIESQVINSSNNTKPNSIEKPPTRRRGGDRDKHRRKTRKSMRSNKKKHTKVHGLRRKLLRITEDDSLFDSESDSDSSDSSSGSDSDSSGSDTGSNGSGDSGGSSDRKKSQPDDKDHGHKKVIIFNKRPKPPLPSFIFLPSMDTPFYPPIGLPPPAPIPMYPMVPVPPMGAPMFPPFPGVITCDDNATTSSAEPSTTTPNGSEKTSSDTTTKEATTVTTTSAPIDRRSRLQKHRRRPTAEELTAPAREPGEQENLKHETRNRLMQKLREKMKAKIKNKISSHDAETFEFLEDEALTSVESFTPTKLHKKKLKEQQIPNLEDVDFKYLSELIHRVNQSEARSKLSTQNKNRLQQTRRHYNSQPTNVQKETNQRGNLDKQGSDDIYYTNLGRQIASMIRNADSKVNQQVNKDVEQVNHQVPFHSVLNDYDYVPRSIWERSIRSPLPQTAFSRFSNYFDESRTHSNEKSLLNLENEVEIFASTAAPLSLRDLENIFNSMQKAHAHIKLRQPMTSTKQSNVSLNVNLLPYFERSKDTYRRFDTPHIVEHHTERHQTPSQPKIYVNMHATNLTNTTASYKPSKTFNVPFRDYLHYYNNNNRKPIPPKPKPVLVAQTLKPVIRVNPINQIYYTHSVRDPTVHVERPKNNFQKKSQSDFLKFLRSMPLVKQTTPNYNSHLNFNNLNYFNGNKHQYMFEASSYPLLSPFKTLITTRLSKPTYFHHPLDHFEYFD